MTTMEDLTKTQIVLLALLVSFITSIATGIITTSLLAQAPQGVTQTIDRVVERTVERVVPADGSGVREITVITEDDLITSIIEENTSAVVRVRSSSGEFMSLGVVVSKQGIVISDRHPAFTQGSQYSIVFSDSSTAQAVVEKMDTSRNIALFRLQISEERLRSLPTISLSKNEPKLGQTVVALQGREVAAASVGRIVSLGTDTALTNISASSEIAGSPILNIAGELVGFKTSNTNNTLSPGVYTTISAISKFLAGN